MTEAPFRPFHTLRVLVKNGVRFVLIGGLAARARGSPSVTRDIDVCYARDAANLQALARALHALGARLRGAPEDVPFILDARTLKMGHRFTFTTDAGTLDILGTPHGVPGGFDELNRTADAIELEEGVVVHVAALEDLIRMKRAAGRPKDLLMLEELGALRDQMDAEAAERRARRRDP